MEKNAMDALTRARVLHAAEVDRANTVENLEASLQEALEAGETERVAQLARAKRDQLLLDVDKHGSVYRLELEEPTGTSFSAWLPTLKKLTAVFSDPWAVYRRRLLDVPQQEGFPAVIEWPEKPQEVASIEQP